MEAQLIEVSGIVQGVGFRPFIYRMAKENNIKGWVINDSKGVSIHAEGTKENIKNFIKNIYNKLPQQALIKDLKYKDIKAKEYNDFNILASQNGGSQDTLIPPDLAMCADCLKDILDEKNSRYEYPFTNCTNCGPRFTIIKEVPYDRIKTTMKDFPMCKECEQEFTNPSQRRFHAQPNACPKCGPSLNLYDRNQNILEGGLQKARELLAQGKILAVKGLGGYHLVCDGLNNDAVKSLRNGKKRDFKPFAVMAKNQEILKKYCKISSPEEQALTAANAPIVILERTSEKLPTSLTMGLNTLGAMLPYTPLHLLLFKDNLELLVMTSGNVSSNPLIYKDDSAFKSLVELADYFLVHDREIYNRCDDSVVKVINNNIQIFRRARGYVPLPVEIPKSEALLACGGELKNTFCLTKGNKAFLSQHLGDLENFANFNEYIETIEKMQNYFNINPSLIVIDSHPNFVARNWAYEQNIPVVEVQHHHAHLASCLADNNLDEKVLGVVCDGTGYGTDGHIWGMEFLLGDFTSFERLAHLEYIPLPSGDLASKEPLRIVASYLYKYLGEKEFLENKVLLKKYSLAELKIIQKQIDSKINTPLSSSCGRLFDAVSAFIGVCTRVSYEGQAAMELEAIVAKDYRGKGYNFEILKEEKLIISTKIMWQEIIKDLSEEVSREIIAAKFHKTIAMMILEVVKSLEDKLPSKKVALSGGVMQNKLLSEILINLLKENEYEPIVHKNVPANDGGISLGQALIGGNINVCSSTIKSN
ncbi:hydrogenase maturation protein HypF [Desulfonispora thiosulfatigenes DSM 11270]|uniref:Carbamoyltransferase n=1 Tax=Desulfonispora thiosulfatigenes DSM 11270 TaxID=656914 RepID=A0A1W1VH34_DESTI|nr:carbamoyltransferase HypF [Desulfonispora thiosulfatigenes]SMB92699.1 hydrogenase maturation protein HypF [Desulfonispora thiosulfatigenes DSM 11270]